MLFFNILVILMCCMVTIAIVSMLTIIVVGSDNIVRRRNYIVRNARIQLNIRNNTVGIDPATSESTICSNIDSEEKREPELV